MTKEAERYLTVRGSWRRVDFGYARVSKAKQDRDRQLHALGEVGIPAEWTFVDTKSVATTDRLGLRALLGYARDGDVIVVHTLDRLGRTVRDTLEPDPRPVGARGQVRNLADPIRIDSSDPDDPMAQLAVVLLALFGQMERCEGPSAQGSTTDSTGATDPPARGTPACSGSAPG